MKAEQRQDSLEDMHVQRGRNVVKGTVFHCFVVATAGAPIAGLSGNYPELVQKHPARPVAVVGAGRRATVPCFASKQPQMTQITGHG